MEAGTTKPIEENIILVRQGFETTNAGHLSNDNNNNRPDYVNPLSQGSSESYRSKIRSPNGFIVAESLRSAFGGLHYDVQEIIAANDKVVSIRSVSRKHDKSYKVVDVHRIIDGKRLQNRATCDDLSFMMQLGLVGSASLRPTAMLGHKIL